MKKTLVLFLNFLMLALLFTGCNKPSGEEEKTDGNEEKFVVTGVYTFVPEANENGCDGSITLYDDGTWKYSGNGIARESSLWNTGTYTVSGSEVTLHCKATCNDVHGNEYNDGVTYYDVFSISNEGDVSTWTHITNVYVDVYHSHLENDDVRLATSLLCFFIFNLNNVLPASIYETLEEENKTYFSCNLLFKRNEL